MKLYSQAFLLVFEMCVAIFVAIFGYAVWDNFDRTTYDTAFSNDNIKIVEQSIIDNKLYLHNISKSDNNIKLTFKIIKKQFDINDNLVLNFNNEMFNLNQLNYTEDDLYYYFDINDIKFDEYETKDFEFDINNKDDLIYEFVTI